MVFPSSGEDFKWLPQRLKLILTPHSNFPAMTAGKHQLVFYIGCRVVLNFLITRYDSIYIEQIFKIIYSPDFFT
jgi:hypothetical protein